MFRIDKEVNMNISMRNDYSYLFNNMGSKSSNAGGLYGINLSDYSSIKSGGYGKLMKAYYSSDISTSSDDKKAKGSSEDILSKLTEAKKVSPVKDKADTEKAQSTASTASSDTKVSSAKDYLDVILESSKQMYANNGGYTDSSSAVVGAAFNTAV